MLIVATWFAIGPQSGANAFQALVLGLILYNGAVFAEIFRAGINAVPKGQSEAAYAIGMRKSMVMRIILIPQAVKIMLPALISQAIVALKDTSLGYAVLAPGLTYAGKEIFGTFRNTIQTAFVMALIYIVLNLLLSMLATWAQKKFVGEKDPLDLVGGIVQKQPGGGGPTGVSAFLAQLDVVDEPLAVALDHRHHDAVALGAGLVVGAVRDRLVDEQQHLHPLGVLHRRRRLDDGADSVSLELGDDGAERLVGGRVLLGERRCRGGLDPGEVAVELRVVVRGQVDR